MTVLATHDACVCVQVEEMEETAARINKLVSKLGRDIKHWPVWSWLKDTIDAFKKTMPLITDLRNPAMRQRHWQQLMDHVGTRYAGCRGMLCACPACCCACWQLWDQLWAHMIAYLYCALDEHMQSCQPAPAMQASKQKVPCSLRALGATVVLSALLCLLLQL